MIKVVIVEDEKMLRQGLCLTTPWNELNCEVVGEASNAIDGEACILKLQPDIVITDIHMPQISGLEMIERVKDKVNCQYIIISGYDEFDYAKRAVHLGVKDYLLKPIDDSELMETLNRAIKAVQERREYEKVMSIVERWDVPSGSECGIWANKKDVPDNYLEKAISIIREQYINDLSLKSVADQLFISESYLAKLFKSRMNYTFLELLTLYRMKEAVRLLEQSDLKIYQIALRTGYKDTRYFSNVFRKIVGVNPAEYRNGYRLTPGNILNQL